MISIRKFSNLADNKVTLHTNQQTFQASSFSDLDLSSISTPYWLDFCNPTCLDLIGEAYALHPLSLEDISEQSSQDRETILKYESYHQICLQGMNYSTNTLSPIIILLFDDVILSFHSLPIQQHCRNVLTLLTRIEGAPVIKMLELLVTDVFDQIAPCMKSLQEKAQEIDDIIMLNSTHDQKTTLKTIHKARKLNTLFLKMTSTKENLLKSLVKKCVASSESLLYWESLQDRAVAISRGFESFEESLNYAHSNYLAKINLEITVASRRSNESMRLITGVTAMFLPLSLFTSLMGVNVIIPG